MSYVFHLRDFDGPLDLLLHLVNQAQILIEDIFISEITEQYLSYMNQLNDLNMDTASEFLTMAANLIYIKSRSLLPTKMSNLEDAQIDPETELIQQLTEYKKYKEAGENLRMLEEDYKNVFFRLPEEWILKERPIALESATVDTLFKAFSSVLNKLEEIDTRNTFDGKITTDIYTVDNRIYYLRKVLRRKKKVTFNELFADHSERPVLIATFLAILEMLKEGQIKVEQDGIFKDIYISVSDLSVKTVSI